MKPKMTPGQRVGPALGYFVGGDPHLMIQKEIGGTQRSTLLNGLQTRISNQEPSWSNGWSHLDTWEHGGDTYLFHYKSGASSSGLMRVAELTNGGDTDCCIEDEYWSTGWNPHIITMSNGDDYLFRYHTSTYQVRITALGAGALGSEVYNNTWSGDLSHFDSLSVNGNTYLFSLDTSEASNSSRFQATEPQNGTTPTSSITTALTDWDLLQAYTLDGTPMIRVYRTSDGFFALYTLDSMVFWRSYRKWV